MATKRIIVFPELKIIETNIGKKQHKEKNEEKLVHHSFKVMETEHKCGVMQADDARATMTQSAKDLGSQSTYERERLPKNIQGVDKHMCYEIRQALGFEPGNDGAMRIPIMERRRIVSEAWEDPPGILRAEDSLWLSLLGKYHGWERMTGKLSPKLISAILWPRGPHPGRCQFPQDISWMDWHAGDS